MNQEDKIAIIFCAVVVIGMGIYFGPSILEALLAALPDQRSDSGDCWPVPHELAPGCIRCWSGGELVYGNYIYHNGGVLCSSDGKEINITGGKSLCVIESNQSNAWEPPTPSDR